MRKLIFTFPLWISLISGNTKQSLTLLAESLQELGKIAPLLNVAPALQPRIALQNLPVSTFFINPAAIQRIPNNNDLTSSFIQDSTNNFTENSKIPPNNDRRILRVATYNVHAWKSPIVQGTQVKWRVYKPNKEGILQTIHALQASVLILQEVTEDLSNSTNQVAFLEKYKSFAWCEGKKAPHLLGNALLTSFDLPAHAFSSHIYRLPDQKANERRCFVKAKFTYNNISVSVYGTHLDVWDETGKTRDSEIYDLLQEVTADSSDIIIIGGDFNAFRSQDYSQQVWDKILKNTASHLKKNISEVPQNTLQPFLDKGFQDSFTFSNQEGPKFTVWTGTVVDFLFIKDQRADTQKKTQPLKTKSYVYYSAASDHIPVIVDLEIQ